ncbi:25987_t:CDS:2 [Dentiscutata erythropus]|uniref:ubiquitinyl hydrolase 1 n=1 Tax=Dentiscutata erythropus TaxID=1348616 RepID=A0A9N9D8N9_9GLOM|nr:25987_t:CDS:2 [Dentiscutata erythropus]
MSRIYEITASEKNELRLYLEIAHKPINDEVASHVATYLNTDPLKLRFTSSHITFGTPSSVIKKGVNTILKKMLPIRYQSLPASANLLYYEILDFNIVELETKKFFVVLWLGATLKEMDVIKILLPKNAIIDDLIKEILQKLSLPGPTNRVRLFEVSNFKILKEYKSNNLICKIQENATLYAEEITQDEIERGIDDKVIQVYHFTTRPSCAHGIPFKFIVKAGELFSATKLRLQARLGMNEADFAEVKIAIVQEMPNVKFEYIISDNVVLSHDNWTSGKYLGLDYVCKTERIGIVGDDRKAIYIKE